MKPQVNFFVDDTNQVMVIRAIGDISPGRFVDLVFEKLAEVSAPWTFNRLFDVRRWSYRLDAETISAFAHRWSALTEQQIFHARIAVVTHEHGMHFRIPTTSENFPEETVCYFDDFRQGIGWLRANDPATFLKELASNPLNHQSYGGIIIE